LLAADHASFIIITLDSTPDGSRNWRPRYQEKQKMFPTSTNTALLRAPLHHNTHPDCFLPQANGRSLSATSRHQPEASSLTAAEIRRIVQDILG